MRTSSAWTARAAVLIAAVGASTSFGQSQQKDSHPMPDETLPTAAFRDEHREVLEHLNHVKQWAGQLPSQNVQQQKQTAQKVVEFFEKHIKPHAEWEEQALYPVVDQLAGGPHPFTSTMRQEHQIVGRWIEELRVEAARPKLDPVKFTRRTDNLLGLLWAHFEAEEEVLLPFIDLGMSKDEFEKDFTRSHAL